MEINTQSQRFPKSEHLCSRKVIERLYAEGHRLRSFPYSVQWMVVESAVPCQVMIVAPKRRFKHAVDRNRLRRLTRESYRRQKHLLLDALREKGVSIALSLVYFHNEALAYGQLEARMEKLLVTLAWEVARQ